MVFMTQQIPVTWQRQEHLGPDLLRDFDPATLVSQVIEQVPDLARYNSHIYTIITELYANALEHSLLGLDSALKDSADGFAEYYRQRRRRLQQLQQATLCIELSYQGSLVGGSLTIEIEDDGRGFKDQAATGLSAKQQPFSGRGLMLLRGLCESISFSESTNRVRAVFSWGEKKSADNAIEL